MQVIKNGSILAYPWTLLTEEGSLVAGNIALPLARYRAEKTSLLSRRSSLGKLGIIIDSDTPLVTIVEELQNISLLVFDCQLYSDGRVFSQIRLLRQQYNFQEDIMVMGDLLQDQLRSMERCGANVFWPRAGFNLAQVLPALSEITVRYQTN